MLLHSGGTGRRPVGFGDSRKRTSLSGLRTSSTDFELDDNQRLADCFEPRVVWAKLDLHDTFEVTAVIASERNDEDALPGGAESR